MQVPLELSMKGIEDDHARSVVEECAAKLEKINDNIISCRVAIECDNKQLSSGTGYRVRVEVTVPPRHDLVASRENWQGEQHRELSTVIHETFDACAKQLRELSDRQRAHVKRHPEQEVQGIVSKLFQDYGFLRTLDGREVYFHPRSVLHPEFAELKEGDGVAFAEEQGEDGPQASTLRVIAPAPG